MFFVFILHYFLYIWLYLFITSYYSNRTYLKDMTDIIIVEYIKRQNSELIILPTDNEFARVVEVVGCSEVNVGDHVFVKKNSGIETSLRDKKVFIIRPGDILLVSTENFAACNSDFS